MLLATAPGDTTVVMEQVDVASQRRRDFQMRTSQSSIQVTSDYLKADWASTVWLWPRTE